ncbi:DUF7684 family protein [Pseudoalteromonas rubra]|uniref:DUF7684 family protein n=1 Tax=Pseudoalteromonas rubra TaxID=43658 RepID=UPI0012DD94C7|nr:hypothetical protein [Pseudoalteromonas rubra]
MRYIHLPGEQELPHHEPLNPYRCVVVIEDEVSCARQQTISKWLVDSGCLYMMAWGKDCGSWDTSVDMANLQQFNFNEVPEKSFVYTTWHQDESLEDVFWFSRNCAFHPLVELKNTVVLHLSPNDNEDVIRHQYYGV